MEIKMNEKRTQVIEALKNATEPMTLAEIAQAIGCELKPGTTNAMIDVGLIKKVGKKKVPKVVYSEVTVYTLGDAEVPANDK